MTTWRVLPFFAACALLAFAGCSSGAAPAPTLPSAGVQGTHYALALASTETLKARRMVVKVQSCVSGISGEATFTAKGKAKGKFRGKFSASGGWNFDIISGQTLWTFAETFKISGRHPADGTITGSGESGIATCSKFGPVTGSGDLQYHLETFSGDATTNLMKNGAKFLEQLH